MPVPILSVRNLTTTLIKEKKPYKVVDNLSFDLHRGKTLALVGESGCGKTITAFSLLRLLPEPPFLPPTGEVLYQNTNLLTLPKRKLKNIRGKRIALVFQNPFVALNPVYTIGFQMKEVIDAHLKLEEKRAYELMVQTLKEVELPRAELLLNAYPHELSGGMLQRVVIALALLSSPDILIADEPTTALDATIQAQILQLLLRLKEKKSMALLMITHDFGVVAKIADEVLVMYAGESIEYASTEKIYKTPCHPYTQGLISCFSKKGEGNRFHSIRGSLPPITEFPKGCRFEPRCNHAKAICAQQNPSFFHSIDHPVKCWLYTDTI